MGGDYIAGIGEGGGGIIVDGFSGSGGGGSRFGVWGLGIGVWGLGFGVWGLGFGVWGLGFGFWGLAGACLLWFVTAPQLLAVAEMQVPTLSVACALITCNSFTCCIVLVCDMTIFIAFNHVVAADYVTFNIFIAVALAQRAVELDTEGVM